MAEHALRDMSKRNIEVKTEELVAILTSNRKKHKAAYDEAIAGYKEAAAAKLEKDGAKAVENLEKRLKRIAEEIDTFDPKESHSFSDHFVLIQQVIMTMPVPKCYEAEYAAAIDMAKWDVRNTLELTYAEFQCFVRDEWDWKADFEDIHKSYTIGPGSGK